MGVLPRVISCAFGTVLRVTGVVVRTIPEEPLPFTCWAQAMLSTTRPIVDIDAPER